MTFKNPNNSLDFMSLDWQLLNELCESIPDDEFRDDVKNDVKDDVEDDVEDDVKDDNVDYYDFWSEFMQVDVFCFGLALSIMMNLYLILLVFLPRKSYILNEVATVPVKNINLYESAKSFSQFIFEKLKLFFEMIFKQ
jgi:hypothetical protein